MSLVAPDSRFRSGIRYVIPRPDARPTRNRLEQTLASRQHLMWGTVAGVLLALWAALALLVRYASRTLRRQTRQLHERSRALMDSYQRLEESSLEAIESLNATVEAKDPDTAGHSLRVQRVALALGEELGLTAQQLDALRFGSLFHDIGKIAVPDGILVKPAKLDYWEYAQMKTHSAEGARIVGKFGRLRQAVPIIRHHHERWTAPATRTVSPRTRSRSRPPSSGSQTPGTR
jgi:putative nucleotidyltransferase with HDIG domain